MFPLSYFEQVGEPGTPSAWDRPSYIHAHVVVDKGGIAELVDRKRTLPPEVARDRLPPSGSTTTSTRTTARRRAGGSVSYSEARLDAAESIPSLLDDALRAAWSRAPVQQAPARPTSSASRSRACDELLPRLEAILATGDLGEQQRLFRDVEALSRAHGLGDVIDGWEPDVAWLRGA